jgi:hypothetical protein
VSFFNSTRSSAQLSSAQLSSAQLSSAQLSSAQLSRQLFFELNGMGLVWRLLPSTAQCTKDNVVLLLVAFVIFCCLFLFALMLFTLNSPSTSIAPLKNKMKSR